MRCAVIDAKLAAIDGIDSQSYGLILNKIAAGNPTIVNDYAIKLFGVFN